MHRPNKTNDKHPALAKNILTLATLMLILLLSSCGSAIRFARVTYPASTIDSLIDKTKMDFLLFQFNRETAKGPKNSLSLTGYAYDDSSLLLSHSPMQGTARVKGNSVKFGEGCILGNLLISKKALVDFLTDSMTHRRRKYTSLIFTPRKDPDNIHIYYFITLGLENKDSTNAYNFYYLKARPCPPAQNCISKPGQ